MTAAAVHTLVLPGKGCPFCGAAYKMLNVILVHFHHYAVECASCNAVGPVQPTPEAAVAAWDKRP
jgi:Lar family restriction alleviation protein